MSKTHALSDLLTGKNPEAVVNKNKTATVGHYPRAWVKSKDSVVRTTKSLTVPGKAGNLNRKFRRDLLKVACVKLVLSKRRVIQIMMKKSLGFSFL